MKLNFYKGHFWRENHVIRVEAIAGILPIGRIPAWRKGQIDRRPLRVEAPSPEVFCKKWMRICTGFAEKGMTLIGHFCSKCLPIGVSLLAASPFEAHINLDKRAV